MSLQWGQAAKNLLEASLKKKPIKESGHQTFLLCDPLSLLITLIWLGRNPKVAV